MMIAPTIQQTRSMSWIRKNTPNHLRSKVNVADVTSMYTAICIMGPYSRILLSELTDNDLTPKSFPFFTYKVSDQLMSPSLCWAELMGTVSQLQVQDLSIPLENFDLLIIFLCRNSMSVWPMAYVYWISRIRENSVMFCIYPTNMRCMSIPGCIRRDRSTTYSMQVRFFSEFSLQLSRFICIYCCTMLRLLCNACSAHWEVLCLLGTGFGYVYHTAGMWTQLACQV